ncbi:glycosyltransferase [Candidatus Poribacteria bacterium]|jgi:glycosyltransferase involved in cell wall biosynthesis|nr:glycosyltransferase [Candidatus Poribacteria bacterium]MBT5710995.1 glycosyltransferase [Candidatus Poribacteria bacterium]MBT7101793.1 glycosyltransferase [Candidatus Poribacteria bacterium]MBT7806831.1 glycosyltransferase [Candidatus Poribacteria bacterium]
MTDTERSGPKLRVLVISHPCVAPAYRRKFDLIAQSGHVELRLIVPEAWPEEATLVRFDAASAPDWMRSLPAAWEGYYTRYFYKRGLAEQMRSFAPDIVHIEEEPYSLCAGQVVRALKRHAPNAKLIFRTSVSRDIRLKSFAKPLLRAVERGVYRRTDRAFVLSAHAKEWLATRGYTGPTTTFPNGIDTRVYRDLGPDAGPEQREALGISASSYVVGYVGRLIPAKGIETLLDAVGAIPDAAALIVGDGPYRGALDAHVARLGIGNRVCFTGQRPPVEVARIMHAMDAFVLPSLTTPLWVEFFGRVLAEGMACGVPVVGSDSGEIAGTIGDAGLVFPEGDATALGEHLTRLRADDVFRNDLIAKGRARAESEFTWETIAARTAEAYCLTAGV